MRKLTDQDIADMIGAEFMPDDSAIRRNVRSDLQLSKRIPKRTNVPEKVILDLHRHTIEQSWQEIMDLATSGVKNATIITGASGILKIKFQEWVHESLLSPYVVSCIPLNNGSFAVKFRKLNSD